MSNFISNRAVPTEKKNVFGVCEDYLIILQSKISSYKSFSPRIQHLLF